MKKLILSISILLSTTLGFTQAPDWLWAKNSTGPDWDTSRNMCKDLSGNVYVVGIFQSDTISFDTITVYKTEPMNIFIAKYDASGHVIWVEVLQGNNYMDPRGIFVDPLGSVYVTGNFSGTYLIVDTITLTSNSLGHSDLFVAKFSSNGSVTWAKSFVGSQPIYKQGTGITTDANGNTYVCGDFRGANLIIDSITLINSEPTELDIFLVKFNNMGNVIWAKSMGGNDFDRVNDIAIDSNGDIYLTGVFESDSINIGAITLVNNDVNKLFVAKYDSNGNVVWAKQAGGITSVQCYRICVDVSKNVFITGMYRESISFDNISLTNTTAGTSTDGFIVKYNNLGTPLWAKSTAGVEDERGYAIGVDGSGNSYMAGVFDGPSMSIDTFNLFNFNTNNKRDVFLAKFDASGNVIWAKSAGGDDDDIVWALDVISNDNLVMTGNVESSFLVFGSDTLFNSGYGNMYVAKIGSPVSVDEVIHHYANFMIFPNPSTGWITIDLPNEIQNFNVDIFSLRGRLVYSVKNKRNISISHLQKGVYVLNLTTNSLLHNYKIILQ